MKRFFLTGLLAGSFTMSAFAQQQADLLREAQRDYAAGDHASARVKFELVLANDPKNPTASNYLRMIRVAEAQQKTSGAAQKAKLGGVVIPSLEFREATLEAALEYLRQQIRKESGQETSFVLQPGVDANRVITLKLANVPLREVLRYIGELAEVDFSFDQYAISVRPRGAASPSPAGGG